MGDDLIFWLPTSPTVERVFVERELDLTCLSGPVTMPLGEARKNPSSGSVKSVISSDNHVIGLVGSDRNDHSPFADCPEYQHGETLSGWSGDDNLVVVVDRQPIAPSLSRPQERGDELPMHSGENEASEKNSVPKCKSDEHRNGGRIPRGGSHDLVTAPIPVRGVLVAPCTNEARQPLHASRRYWRQCCWSTRRRWHGTPSATGATASRPAARRVSAPVAPPPPRGPRRAARGRCRTSAPWFWLPPAPPVAPALRWCCSSWSSICSWEKTEEARQPTSAKAKSTRFSWSSLPEDTSSP